MLIIEIEFIEKLTIIFYKPSSLLCEIYYICFTIK